MAPSAISQRRIHNILLLQKLLNLRDSASPFTLLLDTLAQPAQPVVQEFMVRAKLSKTKIIYVSFQTLRKPAQADVFITARQKQLAALIQQISSFIPKPQDASSPGLMTRVLLVIDSLLPLAATQPSQLPSFLSSLLSPTTSVLATYHTDVPVPVQPYNAQNASSPYSPEPLTTLMYLSTAILRVSNLSQTIEKKRARDRSVQEPVFGLDEAKEGILTALKGPKLEGMDDIVIDMEIRRKSGRGVREVFVLSPSRTVLTASGSVPRGELAGKLSLLDDHPLYATPAPPESNERGNRVDGGQDGEVETTFSLGLTDKQRRDREGVVLPYFDAQRGEGSGEGGRILYEMDRVDDFDEEEDEI